ncbi:MAG: 1-acyl-sn-glycerol-3-phosphate acyltransferase [Bacteroidota bacterium]
MQRLFAILYFWLTGWKITQGPSRDLKKCVLLAAPHTSNFDFVYGRLGATMLGMKTRFLIKKEAFRGPMGWLVKQSGGIPVDRKKNNKIIEVVTEQFNKNESFYLMVTPEGTRKLVKKWRRGFYAIAMASNVPIGCVYLDYRKREIGLGLVIHPSGDYEKDLAQIQDFYRDKAARHPDRFSLSPMYADEAVGSRQ